MKLGKKRADRLMLRGRLIDRVPEGLLSRLAAGVSQAALDLRPGQSDGILLRRNLEPVGSLEIPGQLHQLEAIVRVADQAPFEVDAVGRNVEMAPLSVVMEVGDVRGVVVAQTLESELGGVLPFLVR
jgi:hypothetical protein